jgi:hypothetical protein
MKYQTTTNPALQERLADRLEGVAWHSYYYSAVCPFHQSFPVRSSLFVYPDGYRCASCGAFGSLERLEKLLSGVKVSYKDDEEVLENELPNFKQYRDEYGSYKSAARAAYKTGQEFPILMKYLDGRGLHSVIEKGKIGYIS